MTAEMGRSSHSQPQSSASMRPRPNDRGNGDALIHIHPDSKGLQ